MPPQKSFVATTCAWSASLLASVVALSTISSGCSTPSNTLVIPSFAQSCDASGAGEAEIAALESLRMVTYNIKSGTMSSIDDIAFALQALDADVIALQEVDRNASRTNYEDQAKLIADQLGMRHVFAAARRQDNGDYGVALLSRLPFLDAKRIELPNAGTTFEPRVAIDARVCAGPRALRVVTLHADVYPWAADEHSQFIAEQIAPSIGEGVIVAGDLNATPEAKGIAALLGVGLLDPGPHDVGTSNIEGRRIDYVFFDELLERIDARVIDSVRASDHVPVLTDLRL